MWTVIFTLLAFAAYVMLIGRLGEIHDDVSLMQYRIAAIYQKLYPKGNHERREV